MPKHLDESVFEMMFKAFSKVAVGLLLALLLGSSAVSAQKEADRLRDIERGRLRSLVDADIAAASRVHADDFELINPAGGTLSKEKYLRDVASGDLDYLEWEPGEIRVRLGKDSAIIRYQARLKISVRGSAARVVTFWHTDFYEKRKGQWQIVWAHATEIRTPAPADRVLIK